MSPRWMTSVRRKKRKSWICKPQWYRSVSFGGVLQGSRGTARFPDAPFCRVHDKSVIAGVRFEKSMLPQHIAIIMDGNGRWASQRGLSRGEGHKAGVRAAKAIVTECRTLGIRHLTLYTFSQENWGRPKSEVALLFELLVRFLGDELEQMERQGIRLNLFGELAPLPAPARVALTRAMNRTAKGQDMVVNLALNYSGRDEIVRAARKLVEDGVAPEDVTEAALRQRLYSADQPDPELIIRTSGEWRLSNYLTFQSAYSELYFCDILWPDFTPEELGRALQWFAGRERRFGLTSAQVSA